MKKDSILKTSSVKVQKNDSKYLKKLLLVFGLTSFLNVGLNPSDAQSQVTYNLSAQESYDTNIFLENDKNKLENYTITDPQTGKETVIKVPKDIDGKEDSSFITNLNLGLSAQPIQTKYFDFKAAGNVGALIFSESSDENRATLNSLLSLTSSENFLPKPYFMGLTSNFNSGSGNIGAAEGSGARIAQNHLAAFSFGVDSWQFSPNYFLSADYGLSRNDFLGELRFSDREESPLDDILGRNRSVQGSDYFTNTLHSNIKKQFTKSFYLSLDGSIRDYTFTKVEDNLVSNDPNRDPESEQDRLDTGGRFNVGYDISERLASSAYVGIDASRFKNDQAARSFNIVDNLGNIVPSTNTRSRDLNSLAYGASLNYLLSKLTSLNFNVNQSSGTNFDGSRIIGRTVIAGVQHSFNNNLSASLSGRYFRFDDGDSLSSSGSTDRYEAVTSLNYSLSPSLTLSTGWNYAVQDGANQASTFNSGFNDYEVHRFFIGISKTFVGS